MGKKLKLFLFIGIFITLKLLASDAYEKQILLFDQSFSKSNSEQMLKMHHMLKNIYIQSIIQNDTELKVKALSRLVKSANKLNLDAKPYEKELATLKAKNPSLVNQATKTKKVKKPTPAKPPTKKTDAGIKLAILSVKFDNKSIRLQYNRPISTKDVKSFVLKSKSVLRYVFDLPGALMGSSRTFKSSLIDQVRVAQYNKKIVRVVFSHNKKLDLGYRIEGKTLYIGTNGSSSPRKKPDVYTKSLATFQRGFDPSKKVIVLDAGHGGKDPGAVNGRYQEKKAVLSTVLKIGRELKKRGYRVYYTRSKDVYLQLRTRTRIANDKNADLFISVHVNAAPAKSKYKSMHGIETFFLSPARSERSKNVAALENKSDVEEMNYFSKQTYLNFLNREKIIASNKFALDVHQGMFDSLKGHYKVRDGGVREAPFWVLVGAQMPAILLELGYITHPTEVKRIFSSKYQEKIAIGVANGVDNYFLKNH
jgi:N-acetylmuramoyl-L-alanine amidase